MTQQEIHKLAKHAKFQLEFFLLMQMTGRDEEAGVALQKVTDAHEKLVEVTK
jgi:hypothetical protein